MNVAQNSNDIIAYIFRRNNETWLVYWHPRGNAQIRIPVNPRQTTLYNIKCEKIRAKQRTKEYGTFPVDNRRLIKFDLSEQEVIHLLENSEILNNTIWSPDKK